MTPSDQSTASLIFEALTTTATFEISRTLTSRRPDTPSGSLTGTASFGLLAESGSLANSVFLHDEKKPVVDLSVGRHKLVDLVSDAGTTTVKPATTATTAPTTSTTTTITTFGDAIVTTKSAPEYEPMIKTKYAVRPGPKSTAAPVHHNPIPKQPVKAADVLSTLPGWTVPAGLDPNRQLAYAEQGVFRCGKDGNMQMHAHREYVYRLGGRSVDKTVDGPTETCKSQAADDVTVPTGMSVWFVDGVAGRSNKTTNRLFHQIEFDDPHMCATPDGIATTVRAVGKHLCEKDWYETEYSFSIVASTVDGRPTRLVSSMEVTYNVTGPAKDYTSHTVFTPVRAGTAGSAER